MEVDLQGLRKMSNFGKWIKENRIFSIAAFITNSVILYQMSEWVMSQDLSQISGGAGALVSGVFASIAATYKFVLEFAKSGSDNNDKS